MELQDLPEGLSEKVRLIELYLSDELGIADRGSLDTWLEASPRNRAFLENLSNREMLVEMLREYEQAKAMTPEAKATVHELIRGEGQEKPVRPIRSRTWYRVAAAAMLILAVGLYVWSNKYKKDTTAVAVQEKTKTVPHDAVPGSYKARLTLADGSAIVLDSAAVGKLAQQGNTEVVNKDGRLAYAKGSTTETEAIYNTLTTAKGEIYSLQLSDGSKVWLNSASSIRYPVYFNGGERRVEISGEAYFEVAHLDNNQPFKVFANGIEVRVLGTHFNINAYSDEAKIRTTLLEGLVVVSPPGSAKVVILKPGQQAAVKGSTVELIEHVDTEQAVAWKNGYFQFSEADLKTVMHEIERWYNVEVVFEGNVPQPVFSGKLSRNANASEVLRVLEQNQVHFQIEGKKLL
ncbi:anti-FecI sigma factor, FecR [Niastella koreensis GR20-10]|uniref:Anti-FecI sigma factor, FecR n=1 Tax=Niastella koreensis (strain DSM 17620 / KACC 11465 / NBRC 106392 / GR20-10) TaxID=700598 RepID=G8TLY4_NIAKG|nr:FecR family protein [Niastella koreensis]AEV98744.1 anti-FecI sigma factor, FecR [Niastella koreensis GR20-10]